MLQQHMNTMFHKKHKNVFVDTKIALYFFFFPNYSMADNKTTSEHQGTSNALQSYVTMTIQVAKVETNL